MSRLFHLYYYHFWQSSNINNKLVLGKYRSLHSQTGMECNVGGIIIADLTIVQKL